jgi:hypothetical protein
MSQTPEEIAAELVKDRLFDEKHWHVIGEERDWVNQDAMIFDIAAAIREAEERGAARALDELSEAYSAKVADVIRDLQGLATRLCLGAPTPTLP